MRDKSPRAVSTAPMPSAEFLLIDNSNSFTKFALSSRERLGAVRRVVYARDERDSNEGGYGLETEMAEPDAAFIDAVGEAQAALEALAVSTISMVTISPLRRALKSSVRPAEPACQIEPFE